MIVLAVISGVGQQAVQRRMADRLGDSLGELRGVIGRTATDHRTGHQVAGGVADERELGPAAATERPVSFAVDVIRTRVAALETGGVDGGFGS